MIKSNIRHICIYIVYCYMPPALITLRKRRWHGMVNAPAPEVTASHDTSDYGDGSNAPKAPHRSNIDTDIDDITLDDTNEKLLKEDRLCQGKKNKTNAASTIPAPRADGNQYIPGTKHVERMYHVKTCQKLVASKCCHLTIPQRTASLLYTIRQHANHAQQANNKHSRTAAAEPRGATYGKSADPPRTEHRYAPVMVC